MAEIPAKKKPKPDWMSRGYAENTDAARARQKTELWEAINNFISQNGGWLVSPFGSDRLRVEIPRGSSLAAKLAEAGFEPRHIGTGTRITPNAITETIDANTKQQRTLTHGGIVPVDILEISLSVR